MLSDAAKARLHPYIPSPALRARRQVHDWWRDLPLKRLELLACGTTTFAERRALARDIRRADTALVCAHTPSKIAAIVSAILDAPRSPAGVIVEVGGYKGGSTAKMSRATRLAGRRLVVFDSFAGLPEHRERHGRTIFGEETNFYAGQYAGRLQEVQANVGQCGALDVCDWIEGWFENTMSAFHAPVAVAFIDVDLASSTRTCLKYLYPLLVPGGFSHDGHLPLVLRVLRDDAFWENEIGVGRPPIHGLGHRKLVRITKPRPH